MVKIAVSLAIIVPLLFVSYFVYFRNNTETILDTIPTGQAGLKENEKSGDLSHIVIYTDEFVDIKVVNEDGIHVGQVYLEEPIVDPSGKSINSAKPLRVFDFFKPKSGIYYVDFSASQNFTVDFYIYDKNGDVNLKKISGNGNVKYKIDFDKIDINNSIISSQR